MAHTASPGTHLLPSSPAAIMAEISILNARQGRELLLDSPSILKSLENLQGPFGAGLVPGESSKARRDTPCATWHSADLSISTGLFLTIFGPFHLFLNLFLLFAQVLLC